MSARDVETEIKTLVQAQLHIVIKNYEYQKNRSNSNSELLTYIGGEIQFLHLLLEELK
jgi:hypothetical protein